MFCRNHFKKSVLYQRQKHTCHVHFLYANNSPERPTYLNVERWNGGTKDPLKLWQLKEIEIHHTEDKHGNWYHSAGVKTCYIVMHWTKPSKIPLLYMVTREVKYNGLPIISYFPARATIFRHNTFFSSMRIEIWLLSYMRWFNRLHLYYANFYIR